MTPMIDIVFLLLVFFLFSFKIVVQEGDFNIRMPVAGPATRRCSTRSCRSRCGSPPTPRET